MKGLTSYNIDLVDLITKCKAEDPKAQKVLYERISPLVLGVCRRYLRDEVEAEDVMIESLYKILTKINQFKREGSFEGWCRRIAVNECLMALRKRQNFNVSLESSKLQIEATVRSEESLEEQDILKLMNILPTGYRTIFNLYVIEGYKHREIAELLGISINTSKSQLILARKRMKKLLANIKYPGVG